MPITPDPSSADGASQGQRSAAISNAVVRLYRDLLGRGPTRARTSIRDSTIVVILEDTLTKAERTLVDDGKQDEVLRTRESFQRTMRRDLTAVVERIMERPVLAFMSANHIEPDLACEIFVLEPEGDREVVDVAHAIDER